MYERIWKPFVGEKLTTVREPTNEYDRYAVAVLKVKDGSSLTVGHLPREISKDCSSFIHSGGVIGVKVTDQRPPSLTPMKGIEIPCKLTFTHSNPQQLENAKKLRSKTKQWKRQHRRTSQRNPLSPANGVRVSSRQLSYSSDVDMEDLQSRPGTRDEGAATRAEATRAEQMTISASAASGTEGVGDGGGSATCVLCLVCDIASEYVSNS